MDKGDTIHISEVSNRYCGGYSFRNIKVEGLDRIWNLVLNSKITPLAGLAELEPISTAYHTRYGADRKTGISTEVRTLSRIVSRLDFVKNLLLAAFLTGSLELPAIDPDDAIKYQGDYPWLNAAAISDRIIGRAFDLTRNTCHSCEKKYTIHECVLCADCEQVVCRKCAKQKCVGDGREKTVCPGCYDPPEDEV